MEGGNKRYLATVVLDHLLEAPVHVRLGRGHVHAALWRHDVLDCASSETRSLLDDNFNHTQ
jgi:hypothetical protein